MFFLAPGSSPHVRKMISMGFFFFVCHSLKDFGDGNLAFSCKVAFFVVLLITSGKSAVGFFSIAG